jgi:para-aminobenzoate synthetase/4-amino-4-deoxychorismate lyase
MTGSNYSIDMVFEHEPRREAGVFTSIAVRSGKPVALERHLLRLEHSCRDVYRLALPDGVERDVIAAATNSADSYRVRVDVKPEAGRLRACVESGLAPGGEDALELDVLAVRRWNGAHKWVDRPTMTSPALLVDEYALVLECDIATVFVVSGGEVMTPRLQSGVLPGIARSYVMEWVEVEQRDLPLAVLQEAEEVFVTNAVRGVVPVQRCGPRRWDVVGPVTRGLIRRWGSLR